MTGLDIRIPIGLLFCSLGLLLVGFGLASDPSLYQRSLGINVNFWWGLVLAAAGALTLVLSRRNRSPSSAERAARPEDAALPRPSCSGPDSLGNSPTNKR